MSGGMIRRAGLGVVVGLCLVALLPGAASAQADGSEALRGTLRYESIEGESIPAEGVLIVVVDDSGAEVGNATSDPDGAWEVLLGAPGEYVISIDAETLPEGVFLRDSNLQSLAQSLSPDQTKNVLFRLTEGEGGGDTSGGGGSTLDRVLRLSVEGIKFGLIIAMSSIGLSLIFGTTGLVNFAHGELVTFGALMAYLFNVTFGIPFLIAAPIAVVAGGLAGAFLDLGFWRPLRHRGVGLISMMIISIGLSLLMRNIYLYQFQGSTRPFDQFALQTEGVDLGPVTLVPRDIITMSASVLILIGVALVLQRTRVGKAMRAVSDNRDLAESSGIDVERVILYTWTGGAALAAIGGIFFALAEQVSFQMGFQLLLLMFASVTLGGLGTAYGAFVGSILVGLMIQLSTLVVKPELKNVGALLVLILVLLIRPQGILGQRERVG